MRVASAIPARMTCSISRMVSPVSRLSSRRMATIRSVSVGRRPAMVSSSRSSLGLVASARATSSRLRSGKVRDDAFWCRLPSRSSRSITSPAATLAFPTSAARSSAPTTTFSSTVSAGNGRTIWKVRPMPRRHASSGVTPSMRAPAKRIVPSSGGNAPAIILNSVVLPAPFGPITAKIAPSGTVKLTSWTARTPLKRFDRPCTSRSTPMSRLAAGRQAQGPRQRRPHAVRDHDHHDEKTDAVEHLLGAGRIEAESGHDLAQAFGEAGEQERAEDRAEQCADAADDRREDQLDRTRDVKDLLGEQIVVIEGEEDARDRGHGGGYDDREHLVAERVDAERARRLLVLADREPAIADAAAQQNVAEQEGRHGQRQHHVIEHGRVAAQVPQVVAGVIRHREKEAGGTADPIEMIEADPGKFGERDGEDREIDAGDPEPERQEGDECAACGGESNCARKPDPGGDPEMHVKRRARIAAETDEYRMAERELAGKAEHDVPGLAGIGEIEDEDEDGEQVVVGDEGRSEQQREHDGEQGKTAPRNAVEQRGDHDGFFPRMPCGRNRRTRTRIANANMLLADGVKNNPASASVRPISTPPSSAPGIDPSPPVMTMTKASRV